jgi:hypothetical protein
MKGSNCFHKLRYARCLELICRCLLDDMYIEIKTHNQTNKQFTLDLERLFQGKMNVKIFFVCMPCCQLVGYI